MTTGLWYVNAHIQTSKLYLFKELQMTKRCLYRNTFVYLPLQLFDIANKYHFYHSLALLGAAHCRKPTVVSINHRPAT